MKIFFYCFYPLPINFVKHSTILIFFFPILYFKTFLLQIFYNLKKNVLWIFPSASENIPVSFTDDVKAYCCNGEDNSYSWFETISYTTYSTMCLTMICGLAWFIFCKPWDFLCPPHQSGKHLYISYGATDGHAIARIDWCSPWAIYKHINDCIYKCIHIIYEKINNISHDEFYMNFSIHLIAIYV